MRRSFSSLVTILFLAAATSRADTAELLSRNSSGALENLSSLYVSSSADGRFATFASSSTNLVANDRNGKDDVFLRDRVKQKTYLVSHTPQLRPGNSNSDYPMISADGSCVVFASFASDLVPGDNNGTEDIFVWKRDTGRVTRVSVTSNGGESNGLSSNPAVSADCRYVVFMTYGKLTDTSADNSLGKIYVRDLLSGTTQLISVGRDGEFANGNAIEPQISGDGRYVVFASGATNLVRGNDRNGIDNDVYLFDRNRERMERVGVDSNGAQCDGLGFSDTLSPGVSDDGRFVAFQAMSPCTLAPDDTNGQPDVYVRDRQAGTTTLISVSTAGVQADSFAMSASVSADGRFVAFNSDATNLIDGVRSRKTTEVYVRELSTNRTIRVNARGGQAPNSWAEGHFLMSSGNFVSFDSMATNFVQGVRNEVHAYAAWNPFVLEAHREVPVVRARAASGRVGRKVKLAWTLTEELKMTSESIAIYKGARRLKTLKTPMRFFDAEGHTASWISSGVVAGQYRFCVTAIDPAGNRSAAGCANITLRR